jgi:hypothetical protein
MKQRELLRYLFRSGEQWEVLRCEQGAVIIGKDGVEKQLPLDQTRKFSVFERERITLGIGDSGSDSRKTSNTAGKSSSITSSGP